MPPFGDSANPRLVKLLNAVTATGAGTAADLGDTRDEFSLLVQTTGSPTFSVTFQGSNDGTNWFTLGSAVTSVTSGTAVTGNPARYVRANLTALSGGTLTAELAFSLALGLSAGGAGPGITVTAADTSIVVGGTSSAVTVATGTLDVIATQHAPAAAWSNNSKKITSLANGSSAQDAAAFGQIPATLDVVPAPAANVSLNSHKITSLANGSASGDAAAFGQIPLTDATAAHILADGAQAAGANGTWADSGHVHPATGWIPSDNGLLTAQGGDPGLLTSGALTIAGTLYLIKLPIRYAMTISNLWFEVSAIAVGTSTTTFAGLYSSAGTLLTGSSDVSTPLKTAGPAQCPLTTPQALSAGTFVWGALLTNLGTTQPNLLKGATGTGNVANLGLTAATYRWAVNGTSLSALPSPSITPASNTATGMLTIWCGAS
jgi:hypothetical protein